MSAPESFYELPVQTLSGEKFNLDRYKGKVVLVVNTASLCGFTPQYTELQELQEKYASQLVILGQPCNQFGSQEPGDDKEIKGFCEINYHITFPLLKKGDVNGEEATALFQYLKEKLPGVMGTEFIKWNFTKFLIDQKGRPIKRYSPQTKPKELEKDIEELIKQ